jgi:hypothetical protein
VIQDDGQHAPLRDFLAGTQINHGESESAKIKTVSASPDEIFGFSHLSSAYFLLKK